MCCAFLSLVLLGPRFFGFFWWLFQPVRWQAAFAGWAGPAWLWPILGVIFLPWTTIMYVIVAPGGVVGWEWLWLGISVCRYCLVRWRRGSQTGAGLRRLLISVH